MTNDADTSLQGSPTRFHYRFGIRAKILIALTLFNILVTSAFTINHHRTEKQRILEGLESKLNAAATALPKMLPEGYLDRAVRADAVSPEEYLRLVEMLSAYCAQNNLIYLYTYLYKEGIFWCTSTNGTPEEMAEGDFVPFFDPYIDAPDSIYEAIRTGQPVYETVTDRWGTVLTLFLPMETPGGLPFIAGADVDIAFVDTLLNASLQRGLIVGGLAFLLIFLLSFAASTRFSLAIQRLAAYTGEFTSANFSADTESPLRLEVMRLPEKHSDEIGSLAGSFLVMEDQLAEYLKNLTETTAIKERIENELKLAGQIQTDMLPRDFEAGIHEGKIDLYAKMKPAREAGGDLYDYFYIDEDHLCITVGDVSGKGVPAALFMTVGITILRANATKARIDDPDVIIGKANDLLSRHNDSNNFLTLFLGILNVKTGVLTFADGGHNRPYLRRKGESSNMIEVDGGTALGVFEDLPYTSQTLQLQPGDTFVLYTDGVTEAFGAGETFYGEDRLEKLLNGISQDLPASAWVSEIMEDVARFAKGEEQSDDITVLALRFQP